MLSIKDLVFKKRLVRKLVDWYVGPYIIEEVVSANTVKLRLPTSIKIHPVVNVGQVIRYRQLVEEQKVKKIKPIKIKGAKEWKVKNLNKRKLEE